MGDEVAESKADERSGNGPPRAGERGASGAGAAIAPLLVRIDPPRSPRDGDGPGTDGVIATAIAVAWGLGRGVRLIEELRPATADGGPVDPVEWDLRRRAAAGRLATLVARHGDRRCRLEHDVLERFPPEASAAGGSVIGLPREGESIAWRDDEGTRRFLAGDGALLIVPVRRTVTAPVRFARVMIPLDGSSRAECALPAALAIAHRHEAELVLVHASEAPTLTGNGALDAETLALAGRLADRNRRIAGDYLAELRARHADAGVVIRTRLLEAGDARRRLVEAVRAVEADLVVVAAHGASGHADVPSGNVASYVLERAPVPVLMVGTGSAPFAGALFEDVGDAELRRPAAPSDDASTAPSVTP